MEKVLEQKWCVIVTRNNDEEMVVYEDKETAMNEAKLQFDRFTYSEQKKFKVIAALVNIDPVTGDYPCDERGNYNCDIIDYLTIEEIQNELAVKNDDWETVQNNLNGLIGTEFDELEIHCAVEDFEEYLDEILIISKVEGYTSNFDGHGVCQLFNVYRDNRDSTKFNVYVDDENIIAHTD